jgi:response regulator RpfG family c-di-GMP phosphodiesterase
MPLHIPTESNPVALKIQGLLHKIDRLQLPTSSRRDLESILVRQVSKEIDHALPWQAGHDRRTAALALMIGQTITLNSSELHALKLAAFLHSIGLLLRSPRLVAHGGLVESSPPHHLLNRHVRRSVLEIILGRANGYEVRSSWTGHTTKVDFGLPGYESGILKRLPVH